MPAVAIGSRGFTTRIGVDKTVASQISRTCELGACCPFERRTDLSGRVEPPSSRGRSTRPCRHRRMLAVSVHQTTRICSVIVLVKPFRQSDASSESQNCVSGGEMSGVQMMKVASAAQPNSEVHERFVGQNMERGRPSVGPIVLPRTSRALHAPATSRSGRPLFQPTSNPLLNFLVRDAQNNDASADRLEGTDVLRGDAGPSVSIDLRSVGRRAGCPIAARRRGTPARDRGDPAPGPDV